MPFFNGAAAACAFFGSAREQRHVGQQTGVQLHGTPGPYQGNLVVSLTRENASHATSLPTPFSSSFQTELSAPGVPRHIQLIGCDGSPDLILAANHPKFVTRGISHAGAGGAEVSPTQTHPYPSQLEHHVAPVWMQ